MKNKLYIVVAVLIIIAISVFGAVTFRKTSSLNYSNGQLNVTASFYPMYFFSSEIGKQHANIYNITPAGAEPHDYEPTPQDIARIEKSNMLVLNGGKLEAWGDKILNELKGKSITIVVAGEGLTNKSIEESGQKITDPHVWLSPPLAIKEAQRIFAGYKKTDPSHTPDYEANDKKLETKLNDLDKKYREGLSTCKQKDIVTSHAAFGYLAATYGLNQVPISGISPDAEPSAKQLAEIAQFAKDHSIKYIFFESLVSPKLSETIAREVGAKTMVLDPIEGVTKENMQKGKNYFTIMDDNLNNLRIALQCQ